MFPLLMDTSISPKYEPQPGFDLVGYHLSMWATGGNHKSHSDMAYVWKDWAIDNEVTWSLKPVAKALGVEGVIEVDREHVHLLSVPERMAYNLSDVVATYRLAEMAAQGIA